MKTAELFAGDSWQGTVPELRHMRVNNILCDVQVVASDYSTELNTPVINAHAAVLASGSIFFRTMFIENAPLAYGQIYQITDIDTQILETVVDFIYGIPPKDMKSIELLQQGADILNVPCAQQFLNAQRTELYLDGEIDKQLSAKSNLSSVDCNDDSEKQNPGDIVPFGINLFGKADSKANYRKNNACLICNKYFDTYKWLVTHLWSKHQIKMSDTEVGHTTAGGQCFLCQTLMTDATAFSNLLHFKEQHSMGKYFVCCICGRGFKHMSFATEHVNKDHKIDATYPELRALKLLITPLNIKKIAPLYTALSGDNEEAHEKWRSWLMGEYAFYYCPHCNTEFDTVDKLIDDLRDHVMTDQKMLKLVDKNCYECQICGKTFATGHVLYQHRMSNHKLKSTCNVCRKSFKSVIGLKRHMADKHISLIIKSDKDCNICNKTFTNARTWLLHKKTHTMEKYKPLAHCKDSQSQNIRPVTQAPIPVTRIPIPPTEMDQPVAQVQQPISTRLDWTKAKQLDAVTSTEVLSAITIVPCRDGMIGF